MFARGEMHAEAAAEALRYSRATSSHNIPIPLTPLLGREGELESLRGMLLKRRERLVTLAGPPGIGKTRLGIELAWAVAGRFTDGLFFVPLAPIRDPDLVVPTIAGVLELPDTGDQVLLTRLIRYLMGKRTLLVLDNFEQVLDAAPQVARLLEGVSDLTVLVTSRELLQIRGEQRFFVPTLPLPHSDQLADLEIVTTNPAIELFVQRASTNQIKFHLNIENAQVIAAICKQLDGLPLAIELAAARTGILSLSEIQERLGSRLQLLTGGARDLPPHQRTLRTAIEWSYNLLDEGERRLFARLGVFAGGCTFAAAEAICNAQNDLPMGLLDGVTSLAQKSLLKIDEGAHGSRFSMLETIREYADERLEESKEAQTVRRLHAEYYLALAEMANLELTGSEQGSWLARLKQEYDNVHAALGWLLRQDASFDVSSANMAGRFGAALGTYWGNFAGLNEGRRWLEQIILHSNNAQPAIQARVLHALGVFVYYQSDVARARGMLEESLRLFRQLGLKGGIADVLFELAILTARSGDLDRAIALHSEGLQLRHELDDASAIAESMSDLGRILLIKGEDEEAEKLFQMSLALRRKTGNRVGVARSLGMLGWLHLHRGSQEADTFFREGLRLCRELGLQHSDASMLKGLGYVAIMKGDYGGARRHLIESIELFREQGDRANVARCLEALAVLAAAKSEDNRTAALLGAADTLRKVLGTPLPPADRIMLERQLASVGSDALCPDRLSSTASWAKGQAMTMEDAIAFALEAQPTIPSHQ
jgi:predicted ATPase